MSTLKEKNQNHIFTITTELDPPKSASSAITEEQAQKVAPYVDAVNIADCPMAKMRMSPIALSCIIQQNACSLSVSPTGRKCECRRGRKSLRSPLWANTQ